MTPRAIIGFHGPIGSGKDTLAGLLAKALPSAEVLKFAAPLYSMLKELDPAFDPLMPHEEKDSPLLGDSDLPTRRKVLETLGTEWGRKHIHYDLWVKAGMHKVATSTKEVVLISDVRFANEQQAIHNAGGIVVHLRPNWPVQSTGHSSDQRLLVGPLDLEFEVEFGNPELSMGKLWYQLAEVGQLP